MAAAAGVALSDRRIARRLDEGWDLVVVDRRATLPEDFARYGACGPILGLDEGGLARKRFSYLIDTLPLPRWQGAPNISSTGFLPKPERRRLPGTGETGRVLLTFGGEDPANLTGLVAQVLIGEGIFAPAEITVVVGPLFGSLSLPEGIERLDAPKLLREELYRYDVVFTSFGLTAYEAVRAGVSVILVNPTNYHRTLSRLAGFPESGVGGVSRRRLRRLLADRNGLRRRCAELGSSRPESLAVHIASLSVPLISGCPVCKARENASVARFADRSFFRCDSCGIVYELDFSRKRSRYDASYFFEEYRKQYGRTYLDDFDNIRSHARQRLVRLARLSSRFAGKRLLDAGCAYGPFLVEAKAAGAQVFGVDVSEDAVEYVRSKLEMPCENASLESLDLMAAFGVAKVDIVTMWYVIEHFAELGRVLERINGMLPIGGIFAFSTPNLSGVSGRRDFRRFLDRSPYDHFSVWSPKIAKAVLGRFGFSVCSTHVTGHHPERFPLGGAASGWRRRLLGGVSRLFRLGDTFECYAVKKTEIIS